MKIYSIPDVLSCIIFDIDSTLYTNPAYAHEQVDVQIRHFAALRGMAEDEARAMIEEYRSAWHREHGSKTSLGNTLVHFGVPISESVRWREQLLEPSDFLSDDPELRAVLSELSSHFALVAVTNNPVLPARKTLEALGVGGLFPALIGLDTTGVSKPHEAPFRAAALGAGCPFEECLSVGDRYDIDIALPLAMGMGGILVDGVADVYGLGRLLRRW